MNKGVLLLAIFLVSSAIAQENWDGVLQPQFIIRNKVTGTYNQLWRLSNRFVGVAEEMDFSLQFIEIMHFSTLAVGDKQRLGLGIQYRFRENFDDTGQNEFRLTEQFIWKLPQESGSLAHRLRAEQRFFPDFTLHRFRYRISRDVPLQGQELNLKETFLVGQLEPVFTLANMRSPRYDQRFTMGLGWLIGKKTVWLNSLEYRLENYTHRTKHRVFLISALNISL